MSGFTLFKYVGLGMRERTFLFVFWCLYTCCHCLARDFSRRELLVSLMPTGGILLLSKMKTKLPVPAVFAVVTIVSTISTYHPVGGMKVFLESRYSLHGGTFHMSNRCLIHQ